MKAFINLEETIGKQVGRRLPADPLRVMPVEKQDARLWMEQVGGIPVGRKGVFRFRTHEQADEWLWKKITSKKTQA